MAFRVASASDYAKLLKTANKNLEGVSQWEQYFLQPLQESFEAAGKQISAQTSYDISSAYANYKKQQLNLLQNQALATGFKEQVGEQLQSQYQTAYATSKAEETSGLQTLAQQYQKTLAAEESALLERGQKLADIEKAIFDFKKIDMSKLEDLGYYENIDGGYQLTDAGRDLFDEVLNMGRTVKNEKNEDVIERFSDYLYETQPELYDFYTQNIEDIREVVGGLSRSDTTYSPEERAYDLSIAESKKKLGDVSTEFIKTDFSSKSEESEYLENFAEKINKAPKYRGHVSDTSELYIGGKLIDNGFITINGKRYSADSTYITTDANLETQYKIKSGDIFEGNQGRYYLYLRDKGTYLLTPRK